MILTVQTTPAIHIVNERIVFNTENITKTKIEAQTVQYYLPRLVQGSGVIQIFIQTQEFRLICKLILCWNYLCKSKSDQSTV